MTWNTAKGFYISPLMLDAPWEPELSKLDTIPSLWKNRQEVGKEKLYEDIEWISFRSHDGKTTTTSGGPDRRSPEIPESFEFTSAYYDNPVLKSVIDWFPVEKCRIRLARQLPHKESVIHFDWDNKLNNFDPNKELVRIWIPLDNINCWYRFTNGDVDVSVQLKRGQIAILNVDTVIHGVKNYSGHHRNNLIINARTNFWIKSLPDLFPTHRIINPLVDDPT